MNHQQAVHILRTLSKHRGWSATKAMMLIQHLDHDFFSSATDYAEAITAAMIGQRWESVRGKQGYDTASTLVRWLGKDALRYGNPETLFDAKTQRSGIGYSDKVAERANKASHYLERRRYAGVINGVIFHTGYGAFFQLGIDHESTTPQFGRQKRPIVIAARLPALVNGKGGVFPAILLSSTIRWNGDGFDGVEKASIHEVNRKLTRILVTVLGGMDMKTLQKHLDVQAQEAIAQAAERMLKNKVARDIVVDRVAASSKATAKAAERMLKNKTARDIVAKRVAANPKARDVVADRVAADPKALAQATDRMLKNKTARDIVADRVAADPNAAAQATDRMLKNKTARDIVADRVAADPKALEAAVQRALASGKLAELLATLSAEEKQQIKELLG